MRCLFLSQERQQLPSCIDAMESCAWSSFFHKLLYERFRQVCHHSSLCVQPNSYTWLYLCFLPISWSHCLPELVSSHQVWLYKEGKSFLNFIAGVVPTPPSRLHISHLFICKKASNTFIKGVRLWTHSPGKHLHNDFA